jgi:hypothetical protein
MMMMMMDNFKNPPAPMPADRDKEDEDPDRGEESSVANIQDIQYISLTSIKKRAEAGRRMEKSQPAKKRSKRNETEDRETAEVLKEEEGKEQEGPLKEELRRGTPMKRKVQQRKPRSPKKENLTTLSLSFLKPT